MVDEPECRVSWSDGAHAHVCGVRGVHEAHVCMYCEAVYVAPVSPERARDTFRRAVEDSLRPDVQSRALSGDMLRRYVAE